MNRMKSMGERRTVRRCGARRGWCLLLGAILALSSACGRGNVLDRAREEYEAGRYREAIFLIRHHVRRGGTESPDLVLLEGRSWLRLEVEGEAMDAFDRLVGIDSSYASIVADLVKSEAIESMGGGNTARGRRYIMYAMTHDSLLDFGEYDAVAGELLLEQKLFGRAALFFGRYLEDHSDTAGAAEVMLNLGEAYEGAGRRGEAIEVYRRFRDRFPKSRLRTTVDWKYENLVLTDGEELFERGERDRAEAILSDLTRTAQNDVIRERAFFMLGEIYERDGDSDRAIRSYTEVIHLSPGSSGRLAAQAKERIEKLERSRSKR